MASRDFGRFAVLCQFEGAIVTVVGRLEEVGRLASQVLTNDIRLSPSMVFLSFNFSQKNARISRQ